MRFGINGEPATIVIQTKPNDAPRFYATQSVASSNQIFQLVAENCPNNTVQWGVPKQDANGNTYYDYANFYQTLIVRGPGTYQVRCTGGNYTSFQDITVFPGASDALVIVADRAKALPSEYVKLVAYGCPNGTIKWEIGTQTATGAQITTQGPGNYKARCVGDPTNNGNYAIASILPNGSIVPIVVASIYVACPTDAVTLTAYSTTATNGCPAGWPMQWQYVKDDKIDYWLNNRNAIENFGENYTDVFETVSGSQIVRNGPRIYYARCLKPDGSWIGEFKDKSVTVEPVFPEYLRASNNGPALMGATGIRVAVTEVPAGGITYAWTGPNGFTSTLRNPEITGLTEAKSGIYTVTVKRGNICSVTATTNLVVSGCDIKIKATDPITGLERTALGKNLATNQNNPIALIPNIIALDNLQFKWSGPDNNGITTSQILVNKPGVYDVSVNPVGSTVGCKTSIKIFAPTDYFIDWRKQRKGTFVNGQQYDYYPISKINIKLRYFIGDTEVQKDGYEMGLIKYLYGATPITELLHIIPTKTRITANSNNFEGIILQTDFVNNTVKKVWKYVNGVPVGSYSIVPPSPNGSRSRQICRVEVTVDEDYDPRWTGGCMIPGGTVTTIKSYEIECDADTDGGGTLTAPTGFGSEGTGGGGTGTPTNTFAQKMCNDIASLLDPTLLDLVINNDFSEPCRYERKYKLLLKLIEYGLKDELKKLDLEDGVNNGYENHIVTSNYASVVKPGKTIKANSIPTWNFLDMGCSIAQQYTDLTFQYPSDRRKLDDALEKLAPKINAAYMALSPFFSKCDEGLNCAPGNYSCCYKETFDLIWNSMILKGINPLETFAVGPDAIFMNDADVTKLWEGISQGMTTYSTNNPDNPNEIATSFLNKLIVKYSPQNSGSIPYLSFSICDNNSSVVVNFNTELYKISSILSEELNQDDDIAPCTGTRRVGRASVQGTIEHWLIQYDYMARTPSAVREFKIPQSSANGNFGYADLVVTSSREIYEIKSLPQQPAGETEVERYVNRANEFCRGNGANWIKGTTYFPNPIFLPYPRDPLYVMRVDLTSPGVLIYSRTSKTTNPLPVVVPEAYRERIRRFLERVGQSSQNLEREIVVFYKENPDIKVYISGAVIGFAGGIILGTIIEDIITLGVGIADDFASFALAYRLVRIAQLI